MRITATRTMSITYSEYLFIKSLETLSNDDRNGRIRVFLSRAFEYKRMSSVCPSGMTSKMYTTPVVSNITAIFISSVESEDATKLYDNAILNYEEFSMKYMDINFIYVPTTMRLIENDNYKEEIVRQCEYTSRILTYDRINAKIEWTTREYEDRIFLNLRINGRDMESIVIKYITITQLMKFINFYMSIEASWDEYNLISFKDMITDKFFFPKSDVIDLGRISNICKDEIKLNPDNMILTIHERGRSYEVRLTPTKFNLYSPSDDSQVFEGKYVIRKSIIGYSYIYQIMDTVNPSKVETDIHKMIIGGGDI